MNDLIMAEVRERGLAAVARELRMPRLTLSSVLLGHAREATVLLCGLRWAEYQARKATHETPDKV